MATKKGIALKYNAGAPEILISAKGEFVECLLKVANKYNIPVYKDNDLAELLSSLPEQTKIPEELFKAVAEVFAFCYKINKEFKQKVDLELYK